MEALPGYVEGQVPQNAFDALLSRTAAHISATHPHARVLLERFVESQKAPAYNALDAFKEPPKAIDRYPAYTARPSSSWRADPDPLTAVKQAFVMELFEAIRREDDEHIGLLIQHNIVTANTTSQSRQTPLLEAISMKCISIVKQLLNLGADPDAFGTVLSFDVYLQTPHVPESVIRTLPLRSPLMHASSIGSLPIVKLLMEPPYCANDALVAPDGQIALRIASDNGHRAIVEYLPSRRAGHLLRFKHQNARNIALAKRAMQAIAYYVKVIIWGIPRLFLWSLPKHMIVLPVIKSCKKCWAERDKFGSWCKRQFIETPKKVWNWIRSIPRAIKAVCQGMWRFGRVTLPRWAKYLAFWSWELVTTHIPRATRAVLHWLWEGAQLLGQSIWNIFLKILSFLHTTFEAIVTFLRNVSLKDIRNGLYDLILVTFITFPTSLWLWIKKIENAFYQSMVTLFGQVGSVLHLIVALSVWAVMFIPTKLWSILVALGNSIAKAVREVVVWINPKA
ncbi:hypothetical protein CVT25_009164 [Psilocybe cyanescens]|uniref:Uncharacterized protein n=1 Tax=Psilocybe cyanescens TaxID=93625 RepID=A0A409VRV7_PSICY|nr:hypothetical protein CVT25_009164 [Psilocybe cyanescens]